MNDFPTMPKADDGLPVPCTRLLAYSVALPRWMEHRQPRINGDTRRRKRRLREKLAKQDAIKYGPAIRAWVADQKRRIENEFIDNLRMTASPLFASTAVCGPRPSAGFGTQDGIVGESMEEKR